MTQPYFVPVQFVGGPHAREYYVAYPLPDEIEMPAEQNVFRETVPACTYRLTTVESGGREEREYHYVEPIQFSGS